MVGELAARAIFTKGECHWNANDEVCAKIKQAAWPFGKIEKVDINERSDGDEEDQPIGCEGMMQNCVQVSVPKVGDDRQRECEIENAKTAQGE